MKEQELINKIDKIFTEISKHKLMSTSDEERLLISISIQQAKSEAIKEFEKMINEICGRCCVNKLQELKQKLKEMK